MNVKEVRDLKKHIKQMKKVEVALNIIHDIKKRTFTICYKSINPITELDCLLMKDFELMLNKGNKAIVLDVIESDVMGDDGYRTIIGYKDKKNIMIKLNNVNEKNEILFDKFDKASIEIVVHDGSI